MEVDDAIKNIKMFHFKNLPRFKPELINLLKSLEVENKKLKKENEGLNGYEKMWKALPGIFEPVLLSEDLDYMKEVMADTEKEYLGGKKMNFENEWTKKIEELEAENKKLKKENEAYKGMWKELKPTDDYECLILEERHLLSKMGNLENKYLGGGE